MDSLFELFAVSEEASSSLVLLALVEPLIVVIAFLALLVISIKHYIQTKNRGALLVSISLVLSVIFGIALAFYESNATTETELIIVLCGNILLSIVFLVFVYGFSLICKQARK
jgi:glucan phosphoethanolaminetransferase (alkaline phosphatase superfamily)